ncbi:MAG TPA: cytochrome c, partial [Bacteroidota bacterium]|nr:cytochrome c [Bacteroidota bacterium]
FRSTQTGELPAIEDVEHVIARGVPGTTMPAWSQFLTGEQIADVARYLVIFSDQFSQAWKEKKSPERLSTPALPPQFAAQARRGAELYATAQCAACHGAGGLGDGPSASGLTDAWDHPINPTNLTYKWQFKNGFAPADVYRTIFGGLNGTPMPSYLSAFGDSTDQWALVSYVLSLSPASRPALHLADYHQGVAAVGKRLDKDGRVMP